MWKVHSKRRGDGPEQRDRGREKPPPVRTGAGAQAFRVKDSCLGRAVTRKPRENETHETEVPGEKK